MKKILEHLLLIANIEFELMSDIAHNFHILSLDMEGMNQRALELKEAIEELKKEIEETE